MKSEPDRLDFLIVLLPFVLLGVLGFQIYQFVQARAGRAPATEGAAAPTEPDPAADRGAPGGPPPESLPAPAPGEDAGSPAGATDGSPAGEPAVTTDAPEQAMQPAAASAGATSPPVAGEPIPARGTPTVPSGGGGADESPGMPGPDPVGRAAPARGAGGAVIPTPVGAPAVGSSAAATPAPESRGSSSPDDPPASGTAATRAGSGAGGEPPPRVDPSAPAVVSAIPHSGSGPPGELIPVEIRISNANNVGSVPFHLRYDPAVLRLNAAPRSERGPFLSADGADAQFLVAAGPAGNEVIVGLSLMGAKAGASGDGVLATIYFVSVAPGTSKLEFTHASVRDPSARMMPATFLPASITVAP